jgi:tetratricopeptide (TPR) repeat protein
MMRPAVLAGQEVERDECIAARFWPLSPRNFRTSGSMRAARHGGGAAAPLLGKLNGRYLTERFDEALAALHAALDVWPDSAHLHLWIGVALGYVDRHEEAEIHLRAATELVGRLPVFDAAWGGGLARLGRTHEARAVLEELATRSRHEYVDPWATFILPLILDGWEAAAPALEEMVRVRSFQLPYLLSVPRFRPLHHDPRFWRVHEQVFPGVTVGATG